MFIKIINYMFWWIVASAEKWHQMNLWLSPQSLPFKATTNFQRLHRIMPPKQYTPHATPHAHLQASRRATAKNRHALQVRLWCKSQTCTKASAIHFANLQEQEQWSLRTRKSKQDKLQPHKCNHKEVRDLQEQSCQNNCCKFKEQLQWCARNETWTQWLRAMVEAT